MTLTPLEQAVLNAFHRAFGDCGFPSPETFGVLKRENTGVGRFTTLSSTARPAIGSPCSATFMIEMDGLEHGLDSLVWLNDDGAPDLLELISFGDDSWDGVEHPWRIVPRAEFRDA